MTPIRASTEAERSRIRDDVCEFISRHYADSLLFIGDFCKESRYSKRSVQRALRSGFNTSWTELLVNQRMATAKALLVNTNYDIQKICRSVGYDSPSHFARAFKKMYGKEPREYRRFNR